MALNNHRPSPDSSRLIENGGNSSLSTVGVAYQDIDDEAIDARKSVQQGSFLPIMCLFEKKLIDPATFIIDPNTGATTLHYCAHFGKVKPLKALIERFNIDPFSTD